LEYHSLLPESAPALCANHKLPSRSSVLVLVNSSDDSPPVSSSLPTLPPPPPSPLCLAVSFPCNSSKIIKGEGFRVHLHNGEQQRVVVGGCAGTKRRAAAILSDFGFKAKPGALSPSFGEVEQRLLPPLLGGGRAKGQEGAGARAFGPSEGDGVGHGGVWLGWETTAE
jgi:hypothetical protein